MTVYTKNPLPTLSSVKANRTVVSGAGRAGLGMRAFMAPDFDELGTSLALFDGLFGLLLQPGLALPTCCPRAESPVASLLQQHLPGHSASVAFSLSGWLCWP